jgi:hypothetical protein
LNRADRQSPFHVIAVAALAIADGVAHAAKSLTGSIRAPAWRTSEGEAVHMTRIVIAIGALLLLTNVSSAQTISESQCAQVRQAVAQYGYAAARRHALANYGREAVAAGDRCLGRHGKGRHGRHRT